jgi:hypothetical protein
VGDASREPCGELFLESGLGNNAQASSLHHSLVPATHTYIKHISASDTVIRYHIAVHFTRHLAMSTIASPRASVSVRSPSSTRTSLDSSRAPQPARRNRAALREFYGLKHAPKDTDTKISEESSRTELGPEEDETLTELDAADFNAEAFVDSLLAKEGLQGVLKVEADLVSREY